MLFGLHLHSMPARGLNHLLCGIALGIPANNWCAFAAIFERTGSQNFTQFIVLRQTSVYQTLNGLWAQLGKNVPGLGKIFDDFRIIDRGLVLRFGARFKHPGR